jgi:hypothetical protein
MPIVAPMKTLSGPEFTAWYIKHKKGSGLEGAAYMALSKEDKVKAREHLKRDIEYRDKYRDIRAMWKKCYAGFSHKKKHIGGLKLARYIRDNITKEADLDLFDNVDAVAPSSYYNEPDGGNVDELRGFVKQVNKKYPGSFKCDYSGDDHHFDIDQAKKHFDITYLKSQVRQYNEAVEESSDGEYEQTDVDEATYITMELTISGTNGEKDHDMFLWDTISKTPVAKK